MTKLELSAAQLAERKVTATIVISEELLKHSGAGSLNLLSNELRRSVGIASDGVFLSAIAGASDVSSFSSSGDSSAQITSDLTGALDNLEYGADARLFLICPVEYAKRIATATGTGGSRTFPDASLLGGSLFGSITVVPSDAATDALLVDASQIAAASDVIVLDASEHASVQMDDGPTSGPTNNMLSLAKQFAGIDGPSRVRLLASQVDCSSHPNRHDCLINNNQQTISQARHASVRGLPASCVPLSNRMLLV